MYTDTASLLSKSLKLVGFGIKCVTRHILRRVCILISKKGFKNSAKSAKNSHHQNSSENRVSFWPAVYISSFDNAICNSLDT